MAHLEVEPKPKRPSWVWVLIVLLVILLGGMLLKKCMGREEPSTADSPARDSSQVQTDSLNN